MEMGLMNEEQLVTPESKEVTPVYKELSEGFRSLSLLSMYKSEGQ